MKTIAVIPTYNEESNIENVLSGLNEHVDKIIVVDSSIDSTPDIVRRFKAVELIEECRGKGIQLRKGISRALEYGPDYILQIDGDGEHDPSEIPKMIEKLENDSADIIIGKRNIMRSSIRKGLNKFGLWWINAFTGYGLKDPFSGMMIFRRESLSGLKLETTGFEIEPEIILEAWKSGLTISEINVHVPKLSDSKFSRRDMLKVNRFFDKWCLGNIRFIMGFKRVFLAASCLCGLSISSLLLWLDTL